MAVILKVGARKTSFSRSQAASAVTHATALRHAETGRLVSRGFGTKKAAKKSGKKAAKKK